MYPDETYIESVLALKSSDEEKEKLRQILRDGQKIVIQYAREVVESFNKYHFLYNQYKHGLTVNLCGFADKYPQQEISRRKQQMSGALITYDNDTIQDMAKKGKLEGGLGIPNFGEPIRPHLTELMEEKNLLHIQFSEEVDINELVSIGQKVCCLLNVLIRNRFDFIQPQYETGNTFVFPRKDRKHHFAVAEFTVVNKELKRLDLSAFQVDL